MAEFHESQKGSSRQVCPIPWGWRHQGGDEQWVASFPPVRSQRHFHKAHESIYFPKHTQASRILQETVCSCATNPCLAHISQFSFDGGRRDGTAETREALPPHCRLGLTGVQQPRSAKRRCLCCTGAPLGFMHTRRHPSQPR